jgi:predicted peroxiredoxin
MAQLLISTSTGPADPTRASIAFHIAANGGGPAGVTCAIALAGDATEIVKPGVAEGVRGLGIPPLAELLQKCLATAIPIHV